MRKLILAASVLAIAAPAAAQPRHDPRPAPRYDERYDARDEALRRHVPSGYEIDRMGEMLARVTNALMDIDIAPLADAVDPARRYERGYRGPQTLGDLASRDDPYARERIRDDVRAATAGLGAAAEEAAVVAPVLRRELEASARRIEDAVRYGRDRRDPRDERGYDPRYDRR